MRVLVSDPEQRHAQAIIHALQKFGADVVTASDQRRKGLLGEPLALSLSDDCSTWIDRLQTHGVDVVMPVSIESRLKKNLSLSIPLGQKETASWNLSSMSYFSHVEMTILRLRNRYARSTLCAPPPQTS